jgi:hypothetical protein
MERCESVKSTVTVCPDVTVTVRSFGAKPKIRARSRIVPAGAAPSVYLPAGVGSHAELRALAFSDDLYLDAAERASLRQCR